MLPLFLLVAQQAGGGTDPVAVQFDAATGIYQVSDRATGWSLLGQASGETSDVRYNEGKDELGAFHEVAFAEVSPDGAVHGVASIRSYDAIRAVKFRMEYRQTTPGNGITFPDFSAFPLNLHAFSYRDSTFAPFNFGLAETATPWLRFDDAGRSFIFSPASEFMVSRMVGDGRTSMGEGFDPKLKSLRPGSAQESVIVFGNHIEETWSRWGEAMCRLYSRKLPTPEVDPMLKSYGYWTDNGADYYYNYDFDKGYAGTLVALRDQYRSEGLPLGYLQLDSWWYSKTIDDPAGKPGGETKNAKLPPGTWNRYGGLYEYRANPDLFPNGLAAFHQKVGLPLIVHNRWMDRTSPYHRDYRISGIAVTDPRWWQATASYLASSGVTDYEQDWLDPIYANSPEMASTLGVGDAFTDGMAAAMSKKGLSMQYCMATPRFFMQGLRYPNLTTIRTSGDRFEPRKWEEFLYGSQLAQALGIWPWCDVFKSGETGNMILAALSGGPVGTGDALGNESRENIFKAALPDGVLVKPDRALVPCDLTYIDAATHRVAPFWASTFTDHHGLRTTYLFAFSPRSSKGSREVAGDIHPSDIGVSEPAYFYDTQTGAGKSLGPDEPLHVETSNYAYFVAAPLTQSGIALLGDLNKWVPTGKQRIASVEEGREGMRVEVRFARGEASVSLDGISPTRPTVHAVRGSASLTRYDEVTKRWTIEVSPTRNSLVADVVVGGQISSPVKRRRGH